MEFKLIPIEKPEDLNFILGQTHFIKTVEDVHEALVQSIPGIKFGLAFCEASGPTLVRTSGTDDEVIELAKKKNRAGTRGRLLSCQRAQHYQDGPGSLPYLLRHCQSHPGGHC